MSSLSRTTSREEHSEAGVSHSKVDLQLPFSSVGGAELTKTSSSSSASSLQRGPPVLPSLPPRTKSHSLLSTSNTISPASRKGQVVGAEQSSANVERISMSTPISGAASPSDRLPGARSPVIVDDISSLLPEAKSERAIKSGNYDFAVVDESDVKGSGIPASSFLPTNPDPILQNRRAALNSDKEAGRISFSSLYSIGSAIYGGATTTVFPSAPTSRASSTKGGMEDTTPKPMSANTSPPLPAEMSSPPTTATDPTSVTTSSLSPHPGLGVSVPLSLTPNEQLNHDFPVTTKEGQQAGQGTSPIPRSEPDVDGRPSHRAALNTRAGRSRSRAQRRFSGSTAASSASREGDKERTVSTSTVIDHSKEPPAKPQLIGTIGICALDAKARSKPSRNILTRLQAKGDFEVVVFGDKSILDEEVENWPVCDFLISFFSDGFPLDKAIAYGKLRKPFCVNDLPMQKILWDRRLCLRILDQMGVPTPKRLEVNRDGGPTLESTELAKHVFELSGVKLEGPSDGTGGGSPRSQRVSMIEDGNAIFVDGQVLRKPFVEKPVSGEDHNIRIYFPPNLHGGGGRKLFRKIGNKSSEYDPDLTTPRSITDGESYIYEQFLKVDNAEDVKAYTVGPDFCHAETRRSPVVDGLVRRNTHGKEIRYVTALTKEEMSMATKIANGFGQKICGFDLLRCGDKSYVIDVNGWSFVKDNDQYYDTSARILREMFIKEKQRKERKDGTSDSGDSQFRKPTSHAHRSALKTILKSPSMSKLAGHHDESPPHHHKTGLHPSHLLHRTKSPEAATSMPPNTLTLKLDREHYPTLPNLNTEVIGNFSDSAITAELRTDSVVSVDDSYVPMPASKHSWKLKGMVSVIRHADRTPKQKFKFTFHTDPFVELLKGHQEEVLLKGETALNSVLEAVKRAMQEGEEDMKKLNLLRKTLATKGGQPGTKVQIKPMFRKRKPDEMAIQVIPENSDILVTSPQSAMAPELAMDKGVSGTAALDAPNSASPEATRTATRSDSISGVTFSRFAAAENDLILDKLQLVMKWGGEPTHSARYQAADLGENMRNDMLLMNREALSNVQIFTSSERRVSTSAQIWAASFLGQKTVPDDFMEIRKDLLDDSNAAKDVMDKVKKKLKTLLREGSSAPPQFAWPEDMDEPSVVLANVIELMKFHRQVMRDNFKKLDGSAATSLAAIGGSEETKMKASQGALAQAHAVSSIQNRWCTGEDAELFKERWEKLFQEFCDTDKADPSKISELYDSMKFDALHNRAFLEWVFMPTTAALDEQRKREEASISVENKKADKAPESSNGSGSGGSDSGKDKSEVAGSDRSPDKTGKDQKERDREGLGHRLGFRRKSVMNASSPPHIPLEQNPDSYFKLFQGHGDSKSKVDKRLAKLRELYRLAKVLFDFVAPQEYGIEDHEKLEIGLLTSLPLLKEIVLDLEELQASDDSKCFIYFTKESHIYTLLNCILEGGIKTKISRNSIPELDYLSQIAFELYESRDVETDTFSYSIRIAISPGCHTVDPLDVLLDSKHAIGCAPRRALTNHQDWKEVIETLRDKFHTVKLPKTFLAINLSDKISEQTSESGGP